MSKRIIHKFEQRKFQEANCVGCYYASADVGHDTGSCCNREGLPVIEEGVCTSRSDATLPMTNDLGHKYGNEAQ